MELGLPVLLNLNMMDIVKKNNTHIDTEKLRKILKIDAVETTASRGEGIDVLKGLILDGLKRKPIQEFKIDYAELEPSVKKVADFLEDKNTELDLPSRALAVRILEGDSDLSKEAEKVFPKIEEEEK